MEDAKTFLLKWRDVCRKQGIMCSFEIVKENETGEEIDSIEIKN